MTKRKTVKKTVKSRFITLSLPIDLKIGDMVNCKNEKGQTFKIPVVKPDNPFNPVISQTNSIILSDCQTELDGKI